MSIPFIDRNPTDTELEKVRLILSSYQESGLLILEDSRTIDFIRAISTVFQAQKSQIVPSNFDLVLKPNNSDSQYGISCLTQRMPLANTKASSKRSKIMIRIRYKSHFLPFEFNGETISTITPEKRGHLILEGIKTRENKSNENIDLSRSFYLILFYNNEGCYQILQVPFELPNPDSLRWYTLQSGSIRGENDSGTRITIPLTFGHVYSLMYSPDLSTIKWASPIFHLEPFTSLKNIEYGLQARAVIQKILAIEKLEELIQADSEEGEIQKHLKENPWIFGSEYAQLLDRRIWVRDQQKDFMLKRTADDFLEMIEIKRPQNSKLLFAEDNSHSTFYPGSELSKAIGQVINYLEALDADRHRILSVDQEDVNKISAKLIIGRDGNKDQRKALRNLNSHLHRIEILTYDQLLRIAKRFIEFS
jgi:hypothetical protein